MYFAENRMQHDIHKYNWLLGQPMCDPFLTDAERLVEDDRCLSYHEFLYEIWAVVMVIRFNISKVASCKATLVDDNLRALDFVNAEQLGFQRKSFNLISTIKQLILTI